MLNKINCCGFYFVGKFAVSLKPFTGLVDKLFRTETVNLGSIPGHVKPNTIKFVITASLLDVQQ